MSMERPSKRQRISEAVGLDLELQERRVRNDRQLKSRFESIFEKYGKDFEGIGDEIDMRTGEIVVNNGHLLGMKNERDAGNGENSSEKLESGYFSEDEDLQNPDHCNDRQAMTQKPKELGDATPTSQAGCFGHSDDDADSLMGEIEVEQQADNLGTESAGRMPMSDSELDELANSDLEWMNPRHIRCVAQERWNARKQQLESLDQPSVDPVWRAPPLPKAMPWIPVIENTVSASSHGNESHLDSEGQEISIWASEKKRRPNRRSRKLQTPSYSRSEHRELRAESLSESSNSEQSSRRHRWTQEEENRLRHLKATTTLTCREMEPYFPYRSEQSISIHWRYMISHGKLETRPKPSPRITSVPFPSVPSAATLRAQESGNQQLQHPEPSTRQGDTKELEHRPESVAPPLVSSFIGIHKPVHKPIDDELGRPYRNVQEASALPDAIPVRLTSKVEQRPFVNNHGPNEEPHECFDRPHQSNYKEQSRRRGQTIETDPVALKRQCTRNLMAQGFDVSPRADGQREDSGSIPVKVESILSTPSQNIPQNGTHRLQSLTVAIQRTCVPQSCADASLLLPQVDETMLKERLGGEEPTSSPRATFDVRSERKIGCAPTASKSSVKGKTVRVVIRGITPHVLKKSKPTADIRAEKLVPIVTGMKKDSTTDLSGEIPLQLPCRSSPSAGTEEKHHISTPASDVDDSPRHYARSDRAQSDFADPLGSEMPSFIPGSVSLVTARSQERQGTKPTKYTSAASQPLQSSQPSEKARPLQPSLSKTKEKNPVKIAVAESFSSVSDAMLDCSEDELSFM